MEVNAQYVDGVRFDLEARGHHIVCDQPGENGGADTGMTPPEFLLGSLAACAGYYALQYLKARNLPAEGLHVRVVADKARQPARLGSFTIQVTSPDVEERHREGLLRAVKACLIHNTLLNAPAIETVLLTLQSA